jgi:hypothetical protein
VAALGCGLIARANYLAAASATMSNGQLGDCSRNPDFAHPVLKIIRNCSLILGNYKLV